MANTVWVITTDVKLAGFIEQVAVHGGITKLAAMLVHQQFGFCLIIFIDIDRFITRC